MQPWTSMPSAPASRARRAALGEAVDEPADVVDGHALAPQPVDRLRLVRRAPALLELDAPQVALPAREGELDDVAAVVLVHAPDDLAPEGDGLVAVDVRVVRDDQAARVDRRVRGDDRADAAARELQIPVDMGLVARAVVVVEAAGEARAEDAVLDLERPEPERLEDRRDVGGHAASTARPPLRPAGS